MINETIKNTETEANNEQLKDEELEQASGGIWLGSSDGKCPKCKSKKHVVKSKKKNWLYYCESCDKYFT